MTAIFGKVGLFRHFYVAHIMHPILFTFCQNIKTGCNLPVSLTLQRNTENRN